MNPEDLYQEIIMDHAARPRNRGTIPDATSVVEAENPLCGDELCLYLKVADAEPEQIEKVTFVSQACAICTASASLLTTSMKNIALADAAKLSENFQQALTSREEPEEQATAGLGNLRGLLGVRKFPMRIKCATLSWHAMDRAIKAAREGVKKVEHIEEENA